MKPNKKEHEQRILEKRNEKKGYRKAVFVVIFRTNPVTHEVDYLILRRKLHWIGWEFPKGGIEKQEHILETIKRECFEESGLRIFEVKQFRESGQYRYKTPVTDRPEYIGQSYSLFAAEVPYVNSNNVKIDEFEHNAFKWLKFKDALKLLTWTNQQKCLAVVNHWVINRRV